jgi:hypothetical protein
VAEIPQAPAMSDAIQAQFCMLPSASFSPMQSPEELHMRYKLIVLAGIVAVYLLAPATARAQAACCDTAAHHTHQVTTNMTCCDMPCCTADVPSSVLGPFEMDPQLTPQLAARQDTEVWFHRPVMVGRAILQGRYVIEHDTDRMARGEPCTHIYAYDDRSTPVATFHCTHLERDRADANMVVLESLGNGWQKLTEFQFAGETASHGVPVR